MESTLHPGYLSMLLIPCLDHSFWEWWIQHFPDMGASVPRGGGVRQQIIWTILSQKLREIENNWTRRRGGLPSSPPPPTNVRLHCLNTIVCFFISQTGPFLRDDGTRAVNDTSISKTSGKSKCIKQLSFYILWKVKKHFRRPDRASDTLVLIHDWQLHHLSLNS